MMVLFFVRQYFLLGCWGGVAKVDFFCLHRVFVAAPGLSLVVAVGGSSLVVVQGLLIAVALGVQTQ